MSLLTVNNLEKAFGSEVILEGIQFRLEWGQKLGLVGRNGAGKTTLFRILTGQMEPDRGSVGFQAGIRFGYLRQEQTIDQGWTVYQEAEDAFAPILQMEARLRQLETDMAEAGAPSQLQSVLDEYGILHERFEMMGGFVGLRDIGQVLKQLGFAEVDFDKQTALLSGGEKTRLAMAKLLLSGPDILLLDEPTNHLDLQATEWLENFLRDFGGAVILISHDRYFLDRVVTSVAELVNAKLNLYSGNFSSFWQQREANLKRQEELRSRDEAEVRKLTAFFEKWKNTPSKKNQAVMRIRWAQRIKANMVEQPVSEGKNMRISLKEKVRSGNEVMMIERLSKRYGERVLFDNVSTIVERGQRVGIVGPNGAGKSTLIRMLLGRENPDAGSVRLGANVSVGYFAQEASDLDLHATVLDNMLDVAEMLPEQARTHLGKFLFTADEVFRPVAKLSGGEKNKLALAQITWLQPNLLILDEPTNHLDIDSREALVKMLRSYNGTLILVSHDRYLLNEVTNMTLEVAAGQARLFEGKYSAYVDKKQKETLRLLAQSESTNQKNGVELDRQNPLTIGMNSHQLSKERQKSVKAVAAAEAKVADAEDWIGRIEEALSTPEPGDDLVKIAMDHQRAQGELAQAMDAWERAVFYAEGIGAPI